MFCTRNGRQIILGHRENINPNNSEFIILSKPVNTVFVTHPELIHKHKSLTTWKELRDILKGGWNIGTIRYPGLKFCFVDNGRNYRRVEQHILVLER